MSPYPPGSGRYTHAPVITALIVGPVTAHVAGKLAPHRGAFLGGARSPPRTSINSLICYEVEAIRGNQTTGEEIRTYGESRQARDMAEKGESSTLQQARCVRVVLCLPSL